LLNLSKAFDFIIMSKSRCFFFILIALLVISHPAVIHSRFCPHGKVRIQSGPRRRDHPIEMLFQVLRLNFIAEIRLKYIISITNLQKCSLTFNYDDLNVCDLAKLWFSSWLLKNGSSKRTSPLPHQNNVTIFFSILDSPTQNFWLRQYDIRNYFLVARLKLPISGVKFAPRWCEFLTVKLDKASSNQNETELVLRDRRKRMLCQRNSN